MKTFAVLCVLGTAAFAEPLLNSTNILAETHREKPAPAATSWSVTGKWECKHPEWEDTITISADGKFSRTQGDSGRWNLTVDGDRVFLVLAWNDWPKETVTMMDSNAFRGEVEEGELVMSRIQRGIAAAEVPAIEFQTWRQGDPPVRLIRKEEGFCALSYVTGNFQGGGESVRVYIGEDGFWYLGGESQQEGVAARCVVVRYRER